MGMYRSLGLNFSNFSHHLTTPVLLIYTSHTSHTSHSPLTTRWHQEREQELQAIATEDITISVRRKEHHARVMVIPSMHDGKDRFEAKSLSAITLVNGTLGDSVWHLRICQGCLRSLMVQTPLDP
jgi:hypothetical protein